MWSGPQFVRPMFDVLGEALQLHHSEHIVLNAQWPMQIEPIVYIKRCERAGFLLPNK